MLLAEVDILISKPTNNNTVDFTFTDENGVVVIDATNFTALADDTNHILLSTKTVPDFSSVPLDGDITITVDPSADPSTDPLTVEIIFKGA